MIVLESNPDDSARCNFCLNKEPALMAIRSSENMRNLVVFICENCVDELKYVLQREWNT